MLQQKLQACGWKDDTQDLVHTKQVLCQWTTHKPYFSFFSQCLTKFPSLPLSSPCTLSSRLEILLFSLLRSLDCRPVPPDCAGMAGLCELQNSDLDHGFSSTTVIWNPWDALAIVDALLCTMEVLISCARVWPVHWNSLKSPEVFVFICLFLRLYSSLLSFKFMTSCSSIISVCKHVCICIYYKI